MNAFKLSLVATAMLPAVFACGGDNLTLPSEGVPAHIGIVGEGDGQSRPVSTQLEAITFLVTDSQNRPVPGVTVEFVLDDDRGGALVDPPTATTDQQGQVSTTITLGTQVGPLSGQARLQSNTDISVQFTATATSADANKISMFDGDGQSAPVGTALAQPLVVQVTDNFDNPISGVSITWTPIGGGEVSETSNVTDIDGKASVTRTLGPAAGEQRTEASASGLAGSPVVFTHTATAGNPNSVNIVSGNGQEAPAGSKLPKPLVVRLLDQDGNPIVDRAVSWVVGTGGGTANPATSQTGPDGQASTEWTLGPNPGENTLNAVVSGLSPASFTATATGTGAPTNLAVTTQPPSSVTVGATLSPAPVVQVRDGAGHNLAAPGIEVIVSLASGGGQLGGTTTVTTDANGQAQFADLRITGASGARKLIFAADGLRSATSNKIDVEKASTTTMISQSSESSNPGDPVTVSFTVTSAAGTPTGNVEVTASGGGEKCTAAVAEGHCDIVLTQSGDRSLTATYKGDDVFESSSSASIPHHVNEPQNLPPLAQADAYSTRAGEILTVPAPGVLGNDTDPEGATLTAQLVDLPAHGLVTLNEDGSFTYFPGGLTGTVDTFTYDASDGVSTSRQTVTISIM